MEAQLSNGGIHSGRDVGSAIRSVGRSSSALSQEFSHFVSDIEDLIKSSTSVSGEELTKVKEKIKDRINTAKSMINESADSAVGRARKAAHATHEYVNEEPWKAVGIGAGIGFLLGILVARHS